MAKDSSIPKIEAEIKGVSIELEDLRNQSMKSTLIFKNTKEESASIWEDSAGVLGMFISTELDMNYTNKKIGMFISRAQKDRQGSAKSYHKGQKPLFAQFKDWLFAEVVRNRTISLSSRRVLNVYVNQMFFKELTETRNEALKYRKEILETGPHLTIKLDYLAVLRSTPKVSRSKWKIEKSF